MENQDRIIKNLSPTKRKLLELRLKQQSRSGQRTRTIPRRDSPGPSRLSFGQLRQWFLQQLEPDNPVYNKAEILRLTGPLDRDALGRALDDLVARHEVLRTTYANLDIEPVQVVAEPRPVELPLIDLSCMTPEDQERDLLRHIDQQVQRPFDLTRDLMLRYVLFRLDTEEHVLLGMTHHIASDKWSSGIVNRELSALYAAHREGRPSPLPELPIQYADYATWQRDWFQGSTLEEQLAYWRAQLEGAPAVLNLPHDRPRPAEQTHQGGIVAGFLSPGRVDALRSFSKQHGATLFMTLLAAFNVLLHRYSGQSDILIGAPIAGRSWTETEGLIGLFINTLVLRTDFTGDPSFRELLGQVRQVALEAYAHQDLPFEKLVEELQPERNLSHTPLFQVMFDFLNTPFQTLKLSGLNITRLDLAEDSSIYDLSLLVSEEASGLHIAFEYAADLFDPATIERMLGHFEVLLEGIVADPDQPVKKLPLLTAAERDQLLVAWNQTKAEYPEDQCIHQLFETQVKKTPDALALTYQDQRLTYLELNERANQLAHYLIGHNVGPGVIVGLCVERSVEMLVGLLAVLKAGGAYLPLDPSYPKERLAFMLADTRAPILLTQSPLVETLPDYAGQILCLDGKWKETSGLVTSNPVRHASSADLMYIIYTSGSTGRPKGVMIRHSSVVNFVHFSSRLYDIKPGDRVLQFASLSFDTAVEEIYPTLTSGATLVLRPELITASLTDFLEWVGQTSISVLDLPTAFWHSWVQEVDHLTPPIPSSVRLVIVGGEKALPEDYTNWRRHVGPDVRWLNTYGPTEATVVCLTYEPDNRGENYDVLPIGRPIDNAQAYILDQHLNPVPIGVPGELYIAGAGLAVGYLNRPELSAAKFIGADVAGIQLEAGMTTRLYGTGDAARYLPDGRIEYLGRLDHQVKIRGFRIEPGEIEEVLGQHQGVRETIVMAREDTPGDKRLVAYVVPERGDGPSPDELRSYLTQKLPQYMLPSAFVSLDALPLTPNGKVDHHALPAPNCARPQFEVAFVAPRNELELRLAEVWEQVLGVQPVGVTDNFFDLGGHSLLGVRLFAQIERITSQNLPLTALFQAPTIEQLARILVEGRQPTPWDSLVMLRNGNSQPPIFCLPGTLGNVFTDLGDLARYLNSGQPIYGLQDGVQNPSRVKDLAAHFVDEVYSVQRKGPYILVGICSGGVVAYEMAQQLHSEGQEVALLAMVEPSPPRVSSLQSYARLLAYIFGRFTRRMGHHSRNMAERDPAEQKAYLRMKTKVIANWLAMAGYTARPYPGSIHLFLTHDSLSSPDNAQLGWTRLAAGGVKMREIPGTHDSITGNADTKIEAAHMQVLAERLIDCIDETLANGNRR